MLVNPNENENCETVESVWMYFYGIKCGICGIRSGNFYQIRLSIKFGDFNWFSRFHSHSFININEAKKIDNMKIGFIDFYMPSLILEFPKSGIILIRSMTYKLRVIKSYIFGIFLTFTTFT